MNGRYVRFYGSPDIVDLEPFSTVTFKPYIGTVLVFTSHSVEPRVEIRKIVQASLRNPDLFTIIRVLPLLHESYRI